MVLTAVGRPVIANKPKTGAQRGLSGWTTPNKGFWLKYSNMDPTCRNHHTLHNQNVTNLVKIMSTSFLIERKKMIETSLNSQSYSSAFVTTPIQHEMEWHKICLKNTWEFLMDISNVVACIEFGARRRSRHERF